MVALWWWDLYSNSQGFWSLEDFIKIHSVILSYFANRQRPAVPWPLGGANNVTNRGLPSIFCFYFWYLFRLWKHGFECSAFYHSKICWQTIKLFKHKPAVWWQTCLTAERGETFRKSQTFSSCRLCLQCSFASHPQLLLAAEFKKKNLISHCSHFFVPHVKLEQILIFTFRVKDILVLGTTSVSLGN